MQMPVRKEEALPQGAVKKLHPDEREHKKDRDHCQGLEALLYGDLVEILGFCDKDEKRKLPEQTPSGSQLSVVAGRGFEPLTFRL